MTTDANLVGKGDFSQNIEQTDSLNPQAVEKPTSTAPNGAQSAQMSDDTEPIYSTSPAAICATVEEMFNEFPALTYIDAINEATAAYLTQGNPKLGSIAVVNQLASLRQLGRHLGLLRGQIHYLDSAASTDVTTSSIPATLEECQRLISQQQRELDSQQQLIKVLRELKDVHAKRTDPQTATNGSSAEAQRQGVHQNGEPFAPATDNQSDLRSLLYAQGQLIVSNEQQISLLNERIRQLQELTNRQNSTEAQTPLLSDDTVEIYADIYEVQEQLLDVVDSYLQTLSPVAAINNRLEHWLTTPPADLSKEVNRKQIHVVLGLVNFLVNLKDCDDALKTALADKKEVSCG